jgi:hypothetical protein
VSEGTGSNYRSNYTDDQLWKLVRKAAFELSTIPQKLSTRKFDGGRETIGEPDAPSAKWIAKRLGYPWPELVKIACDANRDTTMSSAAARRAPAESWLNIRHLHFALRYVAKERDEQSFSAYDYDATRGELLRADQHRSESGPLRIILPTSLQIIQIVRRIEKAEGAAKAAEKKAAAETTDETDAAKSKNSKTGKKAKPQKRKLLPELDEKETAPEDLDEAASLGWWNKALVLAGLEPYSKPSRAGVPYAIAIHLYIEATGKIPYGNEEILRLGREGNFSVARPKQTRNPITLHLPEAIEHRAKLGLKMTGEIGKRNEHPVFDLSKLPSDLPRPNRPQDYWDDEERVIDALCEYLDTTQARNIGHPTRRDYLAQWKRHSGDWPSPATLGRKGPKSFTAWIEKATAVWKKRRAKKAA